MLRNTALRAARLAVPASPSASVLARHVPAVAGTVQSRSVSHAVSNVTLADIEKRWESMPPNEQADLWMSLRDRMKGSWGELTLQEKKASYWIAFGPHGPRAVPPPD
ncbi:cytochrome c oxidase subunit IV, partial [Tuber magnatum]